MLQKSPTLPRNIRRSGIRQVTIGRLLIELLGLRASYAKKILKLELQRDADIKKLEDKLFARSRSQERFALQNRSVLFSNRTAYQLPEGGSIQLRESPLSVKYDELDDKAAVAAVIESGAPDDCINNRPTVHKTNLKKAIEENPELQTKLEAKGFRFENGLMFTIEATGTDAKVKHNAARPDSSFYVEMPTEKEKAVPKTKTASV